MADQPTARQILDTPMGENDAQATTVNGYLVALLAQVWHYGEEYGGKRPFGNSGWQQEVHTALAKAGHIRGTFDEDGYAEDVDDDAGDILIASAIKALGSETAPTTLPNLVTLTAADTGWNWDRCLICDSADVTHRALWTRTNNDGAWEISRSAWCADPGCQGDRERSVNLIYVGADGLTRPSTKQDELRTPTATPKGLRP